MKSRQLYAIAVEYPAGLTYHYTMVDETERCLCYCVDHVKIESALAVYVQRHRLLQGVSRLGIAVSGGADSVALFHLLLPVCREAGIAVTLLHLNHGLRAAAEQDERFVRSLAADAAVPIRLHHAELASRPPDGNSLEMAARAARMAFFQRCVKEARLDAVATGHQADDVAETLLLRLARGAGASGLAGLRPFSTTGNARLIRPLLTISASALRAWLQERGCGWREDASNRDESIPRNFIRNNLLPQLEQTWVPHLRARLCQSAETLREDDALLDALASQQLTALSSDAPGEAALRLPVAALLRQPVALQRRVLRLWLFRQSHAEAAGLQSVHALLTHCRQSGDWQRTLPGNALALCRDGFLSVTVPQGKSVVTPPAAIPFSSPEPLRWGTIEITAVQGQGVFSLEQGIGHYPAACSLSSAALAGKTLHVRARQPGDRIAPTGLRGSKKIQDLFVDEKIPEHLRDAIPLVVCDDEIAWVPGYRVARRFAVPAPDAPCLRITVTQTAHSRSAGVLPAS